VTLHSSHWGAFEADETATGLEIRPDPTDPDPAHALLRNVPAMLDERVRVLVPHVRRGFLERGAGPDERRGLDDYVPVGWEQALSLAAGELERVRTRFGNASIFGGSYGWGSAGRFHHAQSQVHRFLNVLGGYTRSVESYSLGAARPLLRRIVGNDDPIMRPTTLSVAAEHTELFVCFGGIPAKNAQVNAGGVTRHATVGQLRKARDRGARFVLISPLRDDLVADLDAEWITPVPGTDTALMLGLAHTLVRRGLHDAEFLRTHCAGFDEWWAYLSGQADGVVRDAAWASRICGISEDRIVALAREMAAHRTMITLSWSLQRARYG
jgi:biotin/methionine sulfoxide reductase